MSDEKKIPRFEMEITLPELLSGPIELEDGSVLAMGDEVQHAKLGVGKILKFGRYESVGICAYVDFGNNVKKEVDPYFLKKVT